MFLVLIRWNWKGRWVQDILLSPQGFESFHSDLPRAWWRVCRVFAEIKSMVACFCFNWRFMLLWVMGVGFDNTCTVSGKWNVSRLIPRLYGWVCKTLRLSPLVVEHSVVVMTAGFQLRRSQIESYGQPIFYSRFMKFVLRISGGIKFWDPAESFDTGDLSSITVRMENLFAFQF